MAIKRLSVLSSQANKTEEQSSTFSTNDSKPEDSKNTRAFILGPRGAGKTSFLYKAYFKYNAKQPNTHFDVIPTPASNVEIIPYQEYQFELWDFAEISSCLAHLNNDTQVIIYMIDSASYENKAVASKSKENMIWLLETYTKMLQDAVVVTVATKQDVGPALDIQDIGQFWAGDKVLMSLLKGHDWRLFSCNNLTGEGLDTVFDYVSQKLEQRATVRSSQQSSRVYSPSLLLSPTPSVNNQQQCVTPWEELPNPYHFSDREFFIWFYQGKPFLFFDYTCLVRIIYLTMAQHQPQQDLFEQLSYVLSITPDNETFKSIQYSETQTLFWIQMVSFELLKSPLLEGENNDFESFMAKAQLEDDCWKIYYSYKVFYSEKACREFLPPDKRSLPNAFRSSSLNLKGSQLNINYQVL